MEKKFLFFFLFPFEMNIHFISNEEFFRNGMQVFVYYDLKF